jgi:hypothetical protein
MQVLLISCGPRLLAACVILQKTVKDALDRDGILHPVNRQAAMARNELLWPANTPPETGAA